MSPLGCCFEVCCGPCCEVYLKNACSSLPKEVRVAFCVLAGLGFLMAGIMGLTGVFSIAKQTAGLGLILPGVLFLLLPFCLED